MVTWRTKVPNLAWWPLGCEKNIITTLTCGCELEALHHTHQSEKMINITKFFVAVVTATTIYLWCELDHAHSHVCPPIVSGQARILRDN